MENKLENKMKFFALYYGQKAKRSYLPEQSSLSEIDGTCFYIGHLIINGFLELKPLSLITDEDASKIGFINGGDFKFYLEENQLGFDKIIDRLTPYRVDYLRSKGYALPWLELSVAKLQEYGWIKLI